MNLKEILKTLQYLHRDLQGSSQLGITSHAAGACLQNGMGVQSRNQVSEMHFDKSPDPSTFHCWKTSFKTDVCSCSNFPTESVDDLETSQSIGERRFPNFEMLVAKIASAMKKIILNSYFKKKVSLEERKRPTWKTDFSVEDRLCS